MSRILHTDKYLMRKKIIFISIIVGIVVGCDWLIGAVTRDAILNVKDVGVNQTNTVQAFFKREADVLILGPSTANHHYDCRIIEDSLRLTCYNAGRDGQNIVYSDMVLEGFLTRCTPKLVIIDITYPSLSDNWMTSLNQFNCYYGFLKPIDDIIDSIGTLIDRVKRISNIYRYNKTWEWLLNSHFSVEKKDLNGYRPMRKNVNATFEAKESHRIFTINRKCEKFLNRSIEICKKNNIEVIMACSPSMGISKGNFINFISNYCVNHNIPFLNWNGDTVYTKHSELFYDVDHLNSEGAALFTKDFITRYKEISTRK